MLQHRLRGEVPEPAERPIEVASGLVFVEARGKRAHYGNVAIKRAKSLSHNAEAVIHVGHLPTYDVRYFTADVQRRFERQTWIEWWARPTNRVCYDWQIDRAILRNDRVEPNLRILI